MGEHDTLLNAVIGVVASVVLSFIPFSTLLGGAVAGYLEGGTSRDGVVVGAISGVLGLIIGAVFFFVFVVFLGVFAIGAGAPPGLSGAGIFLLLVFAALAGLYTVGLSALGGLLGNFAKNELDL
jgi:hypothetical protein